MTFEELCKEVYKCKTNEEVNKLLDKYLEQVKDKPKVKRKGNYGVKRSKGRT